MRALYLVAFLMIIPFANGQAQNRVVRKAQGQINNERFIDALETLRPILSSGNIPKEVLLMAGYAYLNVSGSAEHALELLEKAALEYPFTDRPSRRAIETRFYLGQALHLNYRFDEAIALYESLLDKLPNSQRTTIASVTRELNYSKNAIGMVKNPVNFQISHLGRALNTQYDEHSPVVALDESTIFFTSNRPDRESLDQEGRSFENIYVSYWRDGAWTEAQKLDLPGSYFGNRATVSISPDGQTLLIFQNDGIIGNLYESRFRFGNWSEPTPLPAPINSTWNESHASFSPDGNSIWFASDRPGGYGGKDIYVSHLLPDGNWGYPINAGANVNTELDEESPYMHPDGKTLYFSSEGHNSMGGFDIFRSELSATNEWMPPQNIGYPINTPDDDIFYMPTPDGQRVYYSSRQAGGIGSTDIFMIAFPVEDARSLAVTACHVFETEEKPVVDAVIRIIDIETDLLQGVFRPNAFSGKFVAVLPSGKNYRMSIEAEGFKSHTQEFFIPVRDVYGTRQRAFYLPSVQLDKL
jgi:tetratricopeptide (TPR) repeat protein